MQRVSWHPGARMTAKSSQNRDAIEMTRRGRVFEKIAVIRTIHSSDSSNGDASRNQIHECESRERERPKLGSIETPRPLHAVAQEAPGAPRKYSLTFGGVFGSGGAPHSQAMPLIATPNVLIESVTGTSDRAACVRPSSIWVGGSMGSWSLEVFI